MKLLFVSDFQIIQIQIQMCSDWSDYPDIQTIQMIWQGSENYRLRKNIFPLTIEKVMSASKDVGLNIEMKLKLNADKEKKCKLRRKAVMIGL